MKKQIDIINYLVKIGVETGSMDVELPEIEGMQCIDRFVTLIGRQFYIQFEYISNGIDLSKGSIIKENSKCFYLPNDENPIIEEKNINDKIYRNLSMKAKKEISFRVLAFELGKLFKKWKEKNTHVDDAKIEELNYKKLSDNTWNETLKNVDQKWVDENQNQRPNFSEFWDMIVFQKKISVHSQNDVIIEVGRNKTDSINKFRNICDFQVSCIYSTPNGNIVKRMIFQCMDADKLVEFIQQCENEIKGFIYLSKN